GTSRGSCSSWGTRAGSEHTSGSRWYRGLGPAALLRVCCNSLLVTLRYFVGPVPRREQVAPRGQQDGRAVRPEGRVQVVGRSAMCISADEPALRREIGDECVSPVVGRAIGLGSRRRTEHAKAQRIPSGANRAIE